MTVFYLERAKTELNEDPSLSSGVLRQEGKHHVVHPKQRDEKQSGLGQPPTHSLKYTSMRTT